MDTKSIYIATLHPSTILRVCDSDGFNDSHLHLFLERRTSIGAHGAAGTANCSSSGSECYMLLEIHHLKKLISLKEEANLKWKTTEQQIVQVEVVHVNASLIPLINICFL